MTLLGREELIAVLGEPNLDERLVVSPLLEDTQVGPGSIDLRLGSEFLVMRRTTRAGIDIDQDTQEQINESYERITVPFGEGLWLHPQQLALGATLEFLRLPRFLSAYVLSRSTWGRVGLLVATAVMVQPGFAGALTLELVNEGEGPILLYPGVKIAQLAVHRLALPTTRGYDIGAGSYRSPTGPQPGRFTKDKDELRRIKALGASLASM